VVLWGENHLQPTAEACCDACKNLKPNSPGTLRFPGGARSAFAWRSSSMGFSKTLAFANHIYCPH
jgi:hypothetical protein